MKPCIILFSAFWQDTELIAIMEIKPTQATDFLCTRERPFEPIDLDLFRWVGKSGKFYGIGVLADTLHNPVIGVFLSELIKPLGSLPALADNRPILAVGVKVYAVAHFCQLAVKVFQRERFADSFVHRLSGNIIPRGSPLLFGLVKGVGLFLAAWVFDDGQGILTSKLIGTLTEQPQICFVVVVVHTVNKRNRVHDKVIMQAVGI